MAEQVFTIFQGPDAGRQFVLGDKPMTLGREEGRDVTLHDDRASRLHAKLALDAQGAVLSDAGSSNGTFVNGELIRDRRLKAGDIIVIGANSIVFASEPPSAAQVESLLASAERKGHPPTRGGHTTSVLSQAPAAPIRRTPTHLGEVLDAVADAATPDADERGICVSVERELDPDLVHVDGSVISRAVAVFLADLLDGMPLPNGGSGFGGTLALRASPDPARGGFRVEVIGVGIPVSRARVEGCSKALASLREAAESHGGALEVMPDASGTLIRLRLPVGPTEELQTTISTAG